MKEMNKTNLEISITLKWSIHQWQLLFHLISLLFLLNLIISMNYWLKAHLLRFKLREFKLDNIISFLLVALIILQEFLMQAKVILKVKILIKQLKLNKLLEVAKLNKLLKQILLIKMRCRFLCLNFLQCLKI